MCIWQRALYPHAWALGGLCHSRQKPQKLLGGFAGSVSQVQGSRLQGSFRLEALLVRREGALRVRARIPYARPERIDSLGAERIEGGAGDQALDPLEGLWTIPEVSVRDASSNSEGMLPLAPHHISGVHERPRLILQA